LKIWHIAALLVAGVIVGILLPGRLTAVFGTATLYVFLPALIFEAAWHLDLHVMREHWKPILLLAIPGVALTAAIIAGGAHLAGMQWGPALLLGAILSATDPIAVIAIFRRLNVPKSLATIIESESLLNDAIAVVLYRAALAVLVAGASTRGLGGATLHAIVGVAIGIAIGLALAYLAAFALREAVSMPAQSAATLAGAYGAFALADSRGWSGIFAVIAFGIALREFERHRLSVASAQGVEVFWDRAAMLANFALFFLVGAALDLTRLRYTVTLDVAAVASVILARTLLAYGLLRLARLHLRPFWMTVVRMAGIRGALALALAIATPGAVAQRGSVINATFTVVVATILVGALTLRSRLERLPLNDG
jgi:CPA1 family monovalent cation:H+ antiporter